MLAAVIVTWNSADVIGRCLDSALNRGLSEIIVVDNASSDGTVAEVQSRPGVRLAASNANLGFAAGVNLGVKLTHAPFILLLNPDTELVGGCSELVAALQQRNVAAAAGILAEPHGGTQHGFNVRGFPTSWTLSFEALGLNRLWPSSPINRRYRLRVNTTRPTLIEQPAGAFFAFRRDVWSQLGGFDEGFWPAWFEDVDFCKRIKEHGYDILLVPAARATHLGGTSVRKLHSADRELFWYSNLVRYSHKHFSRTGKWMSLAAVLTGCVLRATVLTVNHLSLKPVAVYSRVFWSLSAQYLRRRRDVHGTAMQSHVEGFQIRKLS